MFLDETKKEEIFVIPYMKQLYTNKNAFMCEQTH